MIAINCIDNQKFKIAIWGYQFPKILYKKYDSNWLRIYIEVDSKMGKWEAIDPCLLTWEFEEITNWLKAIKQCERVEEHLEFIEPNLSFSLTENSDNLVKIKVHFDLESKPQSAKEDDKFFIDFIVDRELELGGLIKKFEMELSKFPMRS